MDCDIHNTKWIKSTRSTRTMPNCVEINRAPERVAVRDSKNQSGPILRFGEAPWSAFLARCQSTPDE